MTGILTPPTADTDLAKWTLCVGCRAMIYAKRLHRELYVCPECGRHERLTAPQRIDQLLDPGSCRPLDAQVEPADPLGFVDRRPYGSRLAEARASTGLDEAVVCVRGAVGGRPVIVAAMDFRFLGGSLGGNTGELITTAAEVALTDRTPLLIVTASGGARMQEGAIALMQMAKTSQALGQLDEAGVLTVSLITDPTYGGVAASYAVLCDVVIAEPCARMGFAGPRVIAQTIRQELPPGFQTAEFLLAHGMVDMIRARPALRPTLARLLSVGGAGDRGGLTPADAAAALERPVIQGGRRLPPADAWGAVQRARHLQRPNTLDYVARLVDDFEELHGDRLGADCPAIVAGLGRLGDLRLAVVGHQKGHTAPELAAHHYGMPSPAGFRRAARVMRLAAKLGLPILTLVDTPGAHPGIEAEEQGQAVAIAENLRLMAGLPVPVVTVVIGEGGSGGALALAVANRVLVQATAVYSVISPEGCASILWRDAAEAPTAAAAMGVHAQELLRLGIVDGIVPEPDAGPEHDHAAAAELLRAAIAGSFRELLEIPTEELAAQRRSRFRRYGAAGVDAPAAAQREEERSGAA